MSNSHPDDISCIATDRYLVYTGCKNVVRAFRHNRQVCDPYFSHFLSSFQSKHFERVFLLQTKILSIFYFFSGQIYLRGPQG